MTPDQDSTRAAHHSPRRGCQPPGSASSDAGGKRFAAWALGVIVSTSLAACARPLPSPTPSRNVDATTAPIAWRLAWEWKPASAAILSRVAVGPDGTAYVMDASCTLHAIGAGGRQLWQHEGHCDEPSPPTASAEHSSIYFAAGNSELRALDYQGNLRSTHTSADALVQVPLTAPNGVVHLQYAESGLRLIAPDRELPFAWPKNTVHRNGYSEAVQIGLVGDRGGSFVQLGWRDWMYEDLATFDGEGRVYVETSDGIAILDPHGEALASCSELEYPSAGPVALPAGGFVVIKDGHLQARRTDCSLAWRTDARDPGFLSAGTPLEVGRDGLVYSISDKGAVTARGAVDGKLTWATLTPTSAGDVSQMAAGPGALFVATSRGLLLVIDRSGAVVASPRLFEPGPVRQLTPVRDDAVAVVIDDRLLLYSARADATPLEAAPVRLPGTAAEAEAEIASFMVDHLVRNEIQALAEFMRGNVLDLGEPPAISLITWEKVAPPGTPEEESSEPPRIVHDAPIRVWRYEDGVLEDVDDHAAARAEYDRFKREHPATIFGWGDYRFRIESIAPARDEAVLHLTASCGLLCGRGERLTIIRSPSGKWWVSAREVLYRS